MKIALFLIAILSAPLAAIAEPAAPSAAQPAPNRGSRALLERRRATRGDWLAGGVEMPSTYYYSPHMALAQLAMKMGQTVVAASPHSAIAMQTLAKLSGSK